MTWNFVKTCRNPLGFLFNALYITMEKDYGAVTVDPENHHPTVEDIRTTLSEASDNSPPWKRPVLKRIERALDFYADHQRMGLEMELGEILSSLAED
jgi:hypothetical protein